MKLCRIKKESHEKNHGRHHVQFHPWRMLADAGKQCRVLLHARILMLALKECLLPGKWLMTCAFPDYFSLFTAATQEFFA